MKKRQIVILSLVLIVVVLIFSMIWLRQNKTAQHKAPERENTKYVKTTTVYHTSHPLLIMGHGRVGSSRNVVLVAEVQGKLMPGEVELKKGASFREGQLLFAIDDSQARYEMQARKSSYLNLLASSLPDLKIDYPDAFKRWEAFFEKIDVAKPLPELPKFNNSSEKTFLASRNILGEYYSIKANEKLLAKYRIIAPFNGSFVDVFSELGTVVNPGSQIARIIEVSNLEINVPIPVEDAQFLEVGHTANVFLGEKTTPVRGKILRIGRYVNPNTQSIDVFIGLEEQNASTIYDGMYVKAEINAGEMTDVMKLPRKAMLNDEEVYVVKDSFLIRSKVRMNALDEEFVYVEGLTDGQHVVVEPLSNPVDSMIVKMLPQDE